MTIFIAVFVAITAAHPSTAQTSSSARESASLATGGNFITIEGRFAIALPGRNHGFQRLSIPTPFGVAKGDAYVWQLKEGSFIVGHADAAQPVDTPEVSKRLFDLLRASMKRLADENTGALRQDKVFELDKHPAIEQRVDLFTGSMIQRTYLVSRRIYQTLSIIKTNQREFEPTVVKALDSFRILSDADIAAKRAEDIAKAEPPQLPQESRAKRVGNDVSDGNLVGRVKSVLEESLDLTDTWALQTKKRDSFDQYNEEGYFLRRELYDYKGNLDTIKVYGYIDGNRVSRSSYIQHEYNPPPPLVASPTNAPEKKWDRRYDARYEYRYDDQKRLVEVKSFLSNGDLSHRVVYKYEGKQVETLIYLKSGELNQNYLALIDEKKNEIERTARDPRDGAIGTKYVYQYEYDSKGNWIKRTTSKEVTKNGSSTLEPQYVDFRTITYY